MSIPGRRYEQAGVIPFRRRGDGFEVVLVTSRRRGCWIFPKGLIEPGRTAAESAAAEAFEEAGVLGRTLPDPVGAYRYRKWRGECRVTLFLLEVETLLEDWPEAAERRRAVLPLDEAAPLLAENGLRRILEQLPGLVNAQDERRGTMDQLRIEKNPEPKRLEELGVSNWPIWTKEASEFPWTYGSEETCYFLEGDVVVTPDGGEPVEMGKGDLVTFPAGMSCTWKIRKAVRKHYRLG